MKKYSILFCLFLQMAMVFAQAPEKMSYQAVVRNNNNVLVSNHAVGMRISILQGSATGTAVYTETQTPTTNANGLIAIEIGTGAVVTGTFSNIDWANGPYFVKTETDPNGGTAYTLTSSNQLMSVPYALYAKSSGSNYLGSIPEVQTDSVSQITYSTAIANANLISSKGKILLATGIVVSLSSNPTEADAVIATQNSIGNYSVLLQGLKSNSKYYYKAFATSTAGTAFGNLYSFTTLPLKIPSIVSDTLSNVSNKSVFVKAKITDDGGSNIIEKGFCIKTSSMPTITDTKFQVVNNDLQYNASLTGLNVNTTYYVRAYAINAQGVAYGSQQVFTTISLPLAVLSTTTASIINYTSASLGGQITSDGGTAVIKRGICYSKSSNPTTSDSCVFSGAGMGTFITQLNNLNSNTFYYARAFAITLSGTSYGNEITFTTLAKVTPKVLTLDVSGIGGTSANSGGNITDDGGSPIIRRGICWSTNSTPTVNNYKTSNGTGTGAYTAVLNSLLTNTTYYVRAYAENSMGIAYGSEMNFTTQNQLVQQPTAPLIGTSLVTKDSNFYLTGGFISSDGGSKILQKGICWNSSGNPTIQDSVVYASDSNLGYFNVACSLPKTCNVTYYFRAFAQNNIGITYGQQTSVSSGLAPTFSQINVVSQVANKGLINVSISINALTDGGCQITERGFCWAVTPDPSFDQFHQAVGSGLGTYTTILNDLISNTTYYVRPYVKTVNGTYFGAQFSLVTNSMQGIAIGQFYAGGIVFYIDSTGQHGLVCTPNIIFGPTPAYNGNPWGCDGINIGGTKTTIGSGAQNTALIIGICKEIGAAARVCDDLVFNGYSDWFLPSIDELSRMNILAVNNIIPIPGMQSYNGTASSSEINANSYHAYYFGFDGNVMVGAKQNWAGVHSSTYAVRSF